MLAEKRCQNHQQASTVGRKESKWWENVINFMFGTLTSVLMMFAFEFGISSSFRLCCCVLLSYTKKSKARFIQMWNHTRCQRRDFFSSHSEEPERGWYQNDVVAPHSSFMLSEVTIWIDGKLKSCLAWEELALCCRRSQFKKKIRLLPSKNRRNSHRESEQTFNLLDGWNLITYSHFPCRCCAQRSCVCLKVVWRERIVKETETELIKTCKFVSWFI